MRLVPAMGRQPRSPHIQALRLHPFEPVSQRSTREACDAKFLFRACGRISNRDEFQVAVRTKLQYDLSTMFLPGGEKQQIFTGG